MKPPPTLDTARQSRPGGKAPLAAFMEKGMVGTGEREG